MRKDGVAFRVDARPLSRTPRRKEGTAMEKQTTKPEVPSRPTWETLETFACETSDFTSALTSTAPTRWGIRTSRTCSSIRRPRISAGSGVGSRCASAEPRQRSPSSGHPMISCSHTQSSPKAQGQVLLVEPQLFQQTPPAGGVVGAHVKQGVARPALAQEPERLAGREAVERRAASRKSWEIWSPYPLISGNQCPVELSR